LGDLVPSEPEDFAPTSKAVSRDFPVLVADDDELDRALTIMKLRKASPFDGAMMVDSARNGAEALEKIRRNHFALVVLDWNMPPLDGWDVLRRMRENGVRVPVVVVSGKRRQDISSDLAAMAATFVNKDELNATSFRNAIAASIQLQAT
jgi:CheY-like chemotaxis protein